MTSPLDGCLFTWVDITIGQEDVVGCVQVKGVDDLGDATPLFHQVGQTSHQGACESAVDESILVLGLDVPEAFL